MYYIAILNSLWIIENTQLIYNLQLSYITLHLYINWLLRFLLLLHSIFQTGIQWRWNSGGLWLWVQIWSELLYCTNRGGQGENTSCELHLQLNTFVLQIFGMLSKPNNLQKLFPIFQKYAQGTSNRKSHAGLRRANYDTVSECYKAIWSKSLLEDDTV